jgi:hypothetical protein
MLGIVHVWRLVISSVAGEIRALTTWVKPTVFSFIERLPTAI